MEVIGIIDVVGWVGSFLFAACALPQSYDAWKYGHAEGLNIYFLSMWFVGEICVLIYTLYIIPLPWPLIVNYIGNMILLLIIFRYKLWPRKQ
jgi:uncharacterized protein with PQ loop repeat